MKHSHEIAIIDSNTLCTIGLRYLIENMMPHAVIRTFNTFEQLIRDTPDMYYHYFVSSQILLEHSNFFVERKSKTIVLTGGIQNIPQISNFHILNTNLNEEEMTRSLLKLQQSAHSHRISQPIKEPNGLSSREIEVLIQIVKGLSNKEIAEVLHISLTTVISHRKNIMDKLNVRSVSGLTIYAVMNGYIEADRI